MTLISKDKMFAQYKDSGLQLIWQVIFHYSLLVISFYKSNKWNNF